MRRAPGPGILNRSMPRTWHGTPRRSIPRPARAQNQLAYIYERGLGVSIDLSEAARWYRFAAEQGESNAQFQLGFLYANGRGVTRDDSEAAQWCRQAAERGHARAQYTLGTLY